MSDWTIREGAPPDAAEIARLFVELGHPATVEEVEARFPAFRAAGRTVLVAEGRDGLLGVLTLGAMWVLHRPKPVGRLSALVVDGRWRGRGLGRELVRAGEARLRAEGCGLVEVTSNNRRGEAHAFYRALGYELTSSRFAKPL